MKIQTSEGPVEILTIKNLFIAALILIIIYFAACHKVAPIEKPVYVPVTTQVEVVKKDEAAMKVVSDSFNLILKKEKNETAKAKLERDDVIADYLNLQNNISSTLSNPVPDTCKKIVGQLTGQFNNLKILSDKKDKSCNDQVSSLERMITTQSNFLGQKNKDYARLRLSLDTCWINQKKLEKYADKVKPRNQVYVGISANVLPTFGYGVDLGLKLKSGIMFEGRAMMLNNQTYGQISIKKIISFKK